MKHWSADTLPPSLIIGWFSWWIWTRFLLDSALGAWSGWIPGTLWYFNPDDELLFGSVPDMMLWITVGAVCLALPALVFRRPWTWQGRTMTCLAHVVVIGCVAYTVAVHRQEARSAEGTRLLIHSLEQKGEDRDEIEDWHLERASDLYNRYSENNQR